MFGRLFNALVLLLTFLPQVLAKESVTIQAESFSYTTKDDIISAQGRVVIQTPDGRFYAEKAKLNRKEDKLIASEHVVLETQDITMKADSVDYAPKKQQGTFENVELSYRGMAFTGKEVEQKTSNRFVIKKGAYSPCVGACKDWYVSGEHIDLTLEKYVWITSAWFFVRGVPVLYLPFAVFPIKFKRQTGFLFPQVSFLEDLGTVFSLPFFINLSPSMDITLTPTVYFSRGGGVELEHRYMLTPYWQGISFINTVYDYKEKAWHSAFRTKNLVIFPELPLTLSLKGFLISSRLFFEEYFKKESAQGASGLPTQLAMHHGGKWGDVSVRVISIQDVLERERLIQDTHSFVLPWIKIQSALLKPTSWLGTSMAIRMLVTRRYQGEGFDEIPDPVDIVIDPVSKKVVSAVEKTPGLDANDVITSTAHLEGVPRLFFSIPLFDIFKWKGVAEGPFRVYRLPDNKAVFWGAPELEQMLSFQLDRVYGQTSKVAYRHVITPSVKHVYRPVVYKKGFKPFFDAPTSGLDPEDSLESEHFVFFHLRQDVIERNVSSYRTLWVMEVFGSLKTDTGIKLEEGQSVEDWGPFVARMIFYFSMFQFSVESTTYVSDDYKTDVTLTGWFRPSSLFFMTGHFTVNRDNPVQAGGTILVSRLFNFLTFSTTLKYSFEEGRMQDASYAIHIDPPSRCWIFGLSMHKRIDESGFSYYVHFGLNLGQTIGGVRQVRIPVPVASG